MTSLTAPAMIRNAAIKINGAALSEEKMTKLERVVVENSMYVPDMVELTFDDPDYSLTDSTTFPLGGTLEVSFDDAGDLIAMQETVFKGEIISLEPSFEIPASDLKLIVRGYDKSHRLYRGAKSATHVEKTDSDIAKTIASAVGLTTSGIEATTEVFKHVYQNALTDMEFLRQRAERIGFEVFVSEGALYFRKADTTPPGMPVELEWGKDKALHNFRPRLSAANQVNEVTVKGWDSKKKEAIVGKASTSKTNPEIGFGGWGGAKAKTAFSDGKSLVAHHVAQTVADANAIAKGILDEINSGFVEADGEADGNPKIKVGHLVKIKGIGTTFAGKYKVTTVQHVYDQKDFRTYFTVSGPKPAMITHALRAMDEPNKRWMGVVPALVVNNKTDIDDQAYVKVKYPWLDDKLESYWARVMIPGGGKERGVYFMPEVNDEVLVAFEHGDFNRPYVLGGLFNGKDAPVFKADGKIVKDGKVTTRVIKTRTGHTIRFVDDDSADDFIEIITAKTDLQIKMDTKNKLLQLINTNAQGEIQLKVEQGKLLILAKEIEVKSQMDTKFSALNFKIETKANFEVGATAAAKIESKATLDLKATGAATLEGTGPTTVKSAAILTVQGSLVKIN